VVEIISPPAADIEQNVLITAFRSDYRKEIFLWNNRRILKISVLRIESSGLARRRIGLKHLGEDMENTRRRAIIHLGCRIFTFG
jgi:hypothetical protein